MSIMDTAAGMAASKFCSEDVVTISVDALKFKRPAYQGDVIRTIARVVWTSPRTIGALSHLADFLERNGILEEICSGSLLYGCSGQFNETYGGTPIHAEWRRGGTPVQHGKASKRRHEGRWFLIRPSN